MVGQDVRYDVYYRKHDFTIKITVEPHYYAPRYYADSDITRLVVELDFLPPGENAKWACLNLLRIALTILKKH